ncbi:hypothetical protein [Vulcanisaeta souniana]|uniref:hypothetical protein n=1 Tax=Vulcanisaeta souniana TaxID=164452 RepID=UPI0006D2A1A3|nr:hypothetical protein [Vulcanisaeta souniana]
MSGPQRYPWGRLGDYATALGISNDLVGNITNAFRDALDNEVYAVLNAEDVTNTFLIDLPIFTGRVINLMIRSTQDVVRGASVSVRFPLMILTGLN